jgi:hypothetical protein
MTDRFKEILKDLGDNDLAELIALNSKGINIGYSVGTKPDLILPVGELKNSG